MLVLRVLLRVRMLYYLKQEVIGEHVNSILEGADSRSETAVHFFFKHLFKRFTPIRIFDVLYYLGILTFGCPKWNSRMFHQAGGIQRLIVVCLSECSNMVSTFLCFYMLSYKGHC